MQGLSIPGQGSGIDTDAIVDALVSGRTAAAGSALDSRQQRLETELSALGRLYSGSLLLESSGRLLVEEGVQPVVSSSRPESLEASLLDARSLGGAGIRPTHFSVETQALARPFRMVSKVWQGSPQLAASTLWLTLEKGGQPEKMVTLAVPDQADLPEVVSAINTQASALASARLVPDGDGYRLVISANDNGQEKALVMMHGSGDASLAESFLPHNGGQILPGQQRLCVIDGMSLSGDSNRIKGYPEGMELHLLQETAGQPVLVRVAVDPVALLAAVGRFVEDYNRLFDVMQECRKDTGGGAAVRRLSALMDQGLRSVNADNGALYRALPDIGVAHQRDGRLLFDPERLLGALNGRPEEVGFLVSDPSGPCARLVGQLHAFGQPGQGVGRRLQNLEQALSGVQTERDRLEKKREELGERLRQEYQVMEQTVRHWRRQGEALDGLKSSSSTEKGAK